MNFKEFLSGDGLESTNEGFRSKSKAAMALHDEGARRNDKTTRDFQTIAGKIANYAETGNPAMIADAAKTISELMDDEARSDIFTVISAHDAALAKSIKRKVKMNENESDFSKFLGNN